jgi:hypothetical protein
MNTDHYIDDRRARLSVKKATIIRLRIVDVYVDHRVVCSIVDLFPGVSGGDLLEGLEGPPVVSESEWSKLDHVDPWIKVGDIRHPPPAFMILLINAMEQGE